MLKNLLTLAGLRTVFCVAGHSASGDFFYCLGGTALESSRAQISPCFKHLSEAILKFVHQNFLFPASTDTQP